MINQDMLRVKDPEEKKQGIIFAAIIGCVTGTIIAIATSFINTWVFRDLPLYLNWKSIAFAWLMWTVLLGLLAGITWLSSEGWKSIVLSAGCMSLTILIFNFIQSSDGVMLNIVVLMGLLLPFTAMLSPLAFIFFWLAYRFVESKHLQVWSRIRVVVLNVIVIFVVGALPGLYVKFDARTEQAVRLVHGILQDAPNTLHRSLLKTEGLADHMGKPYTLSQSPSEFSTVGIDVTAHYDDGYTIICTVVLYPGSDPVITPCRGQTP
ncbi:MAG: hypothetical protein HZB50_19270 [Chloroflexi bacterium]|nr:hypothetical protein [Chloroflexota bacterium]